MANSSSRRVRIKDRYTFLNDIEDVELLKDLLLSTKNRHLRGAIKELLSNRFSIGYCSKCGFKDKDQFNKNRRTSYGIQDWCRSCSLSYSRKRRVEQQVVDPFFIDVNSSANRGLGLPTSSQEDGECEEDHDFNRKLRKLKSFIIDTVRSEISQILAK